MSWTGLFFRIVSRRGWLLLLLVAVAAFSAIAPRLDPPLRLPHLWYGGLWAMVIWCGILLAWRASAERAGRRITAQARHDRASLAVRLEARLQAFLIPTSDDDHPECDELKATLLRRQRAMNAAATALWDRGAPEQDPAVTAHSTELERQDLKGGALVARLAALQRDALVEAERRGWLSGPRFGTLESNLSAMMEAPNPDRSWTGGYTRLSGLVVSITALLLPLSAPGRISAIGLGLFIGAALIAFDALSD